MTEPRPGAQEALWEAMRQAAPPPGTKDRVRAAIEDRSRRRPRIVWLAPIALAAVVLALVLPRVGEETERAGPGGRVLAAADVRRGDRALAVGELVEGGRVEVGAAGHLRASLRRAELDVRGPASLEVRGDAVVLYAGQIEIRGSAQVSRPGCTATIEGHGRVDVVGDRLEVTRVDGEATVEQTSATCFVAELVLDAAPPAATTEAAVEPEAKPAAAPQVSDSGAAARRHARATRAPAEVRLDPELERQTAAYWAAMRRRTRDPAGALADLRAFGRAWPDSALRHEVDLAILDLLVDKGDRAGARAQAVQFLRRYPRSAHAADVRRIAGE